MKTGRNAVSKSDKFLQKLKKIIYRTLRGDVSFDNKVIPTTIENKNVCAI